MLPGAVILKGMEAIAGRVAQVIKRLCPIEHPQPIERSVLHVRRQLPAAFASPDALGFLVGKRSDHDSLLPREW
jgi:hypothetical protein